MLIYIGKRILEKEKHNPKENSIMEKNLIALFTLFSSNFYLPYSDNGIYVNIDKISSNSFINADIKAQILSLYMRIQKTRLGLMLFKNIWKYKHAKMSSMCTDLCMNSLDSYPEHQKIILFQQQTLYTFCILDLLKIWDNALCRSITFSPNPTFPKNPYTNMEFDRGHLANIYLNIKKTNFYIPISIHMFWKCSFNLNEFKTEAYPLLKEQSVYNYIQESDNDTLFYDIINMVESLSTILNNRTISEDLQYTKKIKLISNVKPFLTTFLLSEHVPNPIKQRKWYKRTIFDLQNFFKDNPLAGRRIIISASNHISSDSNIFTYPIENNSDNIFVFGDNADSDENSVIYSDDDDAVSEQYNEILDGSGDES